MPAFHVLRVRRLGQVIDALAGCHGMRLSALRGTIAPGGSRQSLPRRPSAGMWKTIGYLTLLCGVFIALLITLSIIGLQSS